MNSFSKADGRCQAAFQSCTEVYHAYTSGKETPVVFTDSHQMVFAMNAIAFAAFKSMEAIRIVSFAVMDNHFHFIIVGSAEDIAAFYACLQKKLKKTIPLAAKMKLSVKPITDLSAMRNCIVYVNRNGYVSNPNYTPFSYPWSTGRHYFNDVPSHLTYADLSFEQKRLMLRGRAVYFPDSWMVTDEYISPVSYCALRFGMSLFRDAHQYFYMVSKNVEAYSGIAVEIDDGEFLTDQELFAQLRKILREQYHLDSIMYLSKSQKLDVARMLHFNFRSSNGQVRRMLGLTEYEVNSIFPKAISKIPPR